MCEKLKGTMKPPLSKLCSLLTALSCLWAHFASAASISWTNTSPSGGNWSLTNNWKPNRVPGPGDTVFITSNGTYTVTVDIPVEIAALALGAASGKQTLDVGANTFRMTNSSTVNTNGVLA